MKKLLLFLFIVGAIVGGVFMMRVLTSPDTDVTQELLATDSLERIDTSGATGLDVSSIRARFGQWFDTAKDSATSEGETPTQKLQEQEVLQEQEEKPIPVPEVAVPDGVFSDDFSGERILEETATKEESRSDHWWLSSGGYMITKEGSGKTIHGALAASDKWFEKYASGTSADISDRGKHPQNVFRFVQREQWHNYEQEVFFRIDRQILSTHEERGAANGFFLFNRYKDEDNLYAVGFRVDGKIVIKKKFEGIYTTLFESNLVEGDYDTKESPLLLPTETWIGIRSAVEDIGGGRVNIKVYADIGRSGNWEIVGSATDQSKDEGQPALTGPGHAGFRSDFMDISFDEYTIKEL